MALLLFEDQYRVSPIFHEVLPHSQLLARFHHAEFPRKRNQVGILVSLTKKLHRVSPIVRTSQYQFSTLEKTKQGYHPTSEVEDDTNDSVLAIRLIIGRDFAVTRSSPESC